MLNGDLVWEVLGKSYRSIYNEKRGRNQRVPPTVVEEMERLGWVRRMENPTGQRLEGWEPTDSGRALAASCQFQPPSRRKPASSLPHH